MGFQWLRSEVVNAYIWWLFTDKGNVTPPLGQFQNIILLRWLQEELTYKSSAYVLSTDYYLSIGIILFLWYFVSQSKKKE